MIIPSVAAPSLTKALAEVRAELWSLGGFSLLINLLMLATSIYMLQVFDRVLASGSMATLLGLTALALIAILVQSILEMIRQRMLTRAGGWLETSLGRTVIDASMAARLRGFAPGGQGLRDLAELKRFFGGDSVSAFLDAPWVPCFLLVIWLMHPLLGVMATLGALALLVLAVVNDRLTKKPTAEAMALARLNQNGVEELIANSEIVEALGMRGNVAGRWEERQAAALKKHLAGADVASSVLAASRYLRMALQVGILGLGAFLTVKGELTAGGMIAGSILLGRAYGPVEKSMSAWRALLGARSATASLDKLLAFNATRGGGLALPKPDGRLEVTGLRYQPPGADAPILKQVGFELQPGECCVVIGASGAGKSTLARLLVGAYQPSAGEVRLDDADVSPWDSEDLGPDLGYLPHSVELFAGSVAQNIARMGAVDPAAVIEAARLAGAHRMILRLQHGYETDIGSLGDKLSGGQRQRLGLARALYGDPSFIVLDEPNANLDPAGEAALFEALNTLKERKKTIVLVVHNPHAFNMADKVLYLRDGAVFAFGPRRAVFASLAARQQPAAAQPRALGQARVQGQAQAQPEGQARAQVQGQGQDSIVAMPRPATALAS